MLAFTRHPAPVVRTYAFRALLRQHDAQGAFDVIQTSTQDTALFSHQFGCIGGTSTVRTFMLVNFRLAAEGGQILLTPAQQKQAESLYDQFLDCDSEKRIVARQEKHSK